MAYIGKEPTTGNFIYRQGKRVFKLDLDVKEE